MNDAGSRAEAAAQRSELGSTLDMVDAARRFLAECRLDDPNLPYLLPLAFGTWIHGEEIGPSVARHIEACLAEGRPGSFLRLGDGEGNLLALQIEGHEEFATYCLRYRSMKHFGAPEVLVDHADEILPPFERAVRNATVVGAPVLMGTASGFEEQAGLEEPQLDWVAGYAGKAAAHEYLARNWNELGLADKIGADAGYSWELLPYYESLIRGRRIGLVSCRSELPDALAEAYGALAVEFHPVPEQALFTTSEDTGHFPERYGQLLHELREVPPGTLYLVAAGILSEIYCDVIRESGAVAVDIGAVADLWCGVPTRLRARPLIPDWTIAQDAS